MDTWHDNFVLITALVELNKQISAYVLRTLDADAGRAAPASPTEEHTLGARLIAWGTNLQTRAIQSQADPLIEPSGEPTAESTSS